jgi:hypothetical protein
VSFSLIDFGETPAFTSKIRAVGPLNGLTSIEQRSVDA